MQGKQQTDRFTVYRNIQRKTNSAQNQRYTVNGKTWG
jgi:hypothetical protein